VAGPEVKSMIKAFENIGNNNPLRQLNPNDRRWLWAVLSVYQAMTQAGAERSFFDELEDLSQTARRAMKLASSIEISTSQGKFATIVRDLAAAHPPCFYLLPLLLKEYAKLIEHHLDSLGKAGHKFKTERNKYVVAASEFVNLKTGAHNDEHLADLLQQIGATEGEEGIEDTSGDAIRKKRQQLKKEYPAMYEETLVIARGEKLCADL
jgi:hypothetical protein